VERSVIVSVRVSSETCDLLTFFRILGLVKLMRISRSAQTVAVPRIEP
jgi:hypothetical protein